MDLANVVDDVIRSFLFQIQNGGPIGAYRTLHKGKVCNIKCVMEIYNSYSGRVDFYVTNDKATIKHVYIVHNSNKNEIYTLRNKVVNVIEEFNRITKVTLPTMPTTKRKVIIKRSVSV